MRSQDEIASRALSLYSCLFCLFAEEIDKRFVTNWMQRFRIRTDYSNLESRFLGDEQLSEDELDTLSDRVEAAFALCWALGKVSKLDPSSYVDENLDDLFPDIRAGESVQRFLADIRLRSVDELIEAIDLYYVLHWGLVEAKRRHIERPGKVDTYVIVERRLALEWSISSEAWDDISLDT